MLKSTRVVIFVGVVSGCASGPQSSESDTMGDARVGTPDAGAASGSCSEGQSTTCTCPDADGGAGQAGTQQCFEGMWLLCNCQRVQDMNPVSTAGDCLPGYYAGAFEGEYRSGFQFGGTLQVSGALNLTLNQQMEGAGEFANYTISGGKVTGKANDRFPFNGTLTGQLNCTTKVFMGVLEGCYQVVEQLTGLAQGCFKGPMNAKYDAASKSFVAGTWDVLEPETLVFQMLGGNGTWTAPFSSATSPDDPADAGATDADAAAGSATDAGVADAAP